MPMRGSSAPGISGPTAGGLVLIALAAIGCASSPPLEYSPAALRSEAARRAPSLDPSQVSVPFEVGAAPVQHVRRLLRHEDSQTRARVLADLLLDPEGFDLRYEWATTAPAAATLKRGVGNCFSLSSVLVGLARGLGLRAYYVEVEVAKPEWRRDGMVMVQADHIAAVLISGGERVFVDFSGQLDRIHSLRVIGDMEALAHYYNNRGYELLHLAEREGEPVPWSSALESFQVATRLAPSMARAWSNLGVARAKLGDPVGAKHAYQKALALADDTQSAHLNLALLHLREGSLDAAAEHLRAAGELDPRNPQLESLRNALLVEGVDPDARTAPGADLPD